MTAKIMAQKIREFVENVSAERLKEDLEKYKRMAIKLGATDAKVVTKDIIVIDERVRARCSSPRCPYYGTNLNCPPHTMWNLDWTRKIVSKYEYGILIMLRVSPEEHAGQNYYDTHAHPVPGAIKMYEIVSKIQSAAFYDGYHLAIGFGGGPACKRVFCPNVECKGIKGEGCRMALKVNPSMHSVGMNAYSMASRVGWSIYPIGKKVDPLQVPYGTELGLVLVY